MIDLDASLMGWGATSSNKRTGGPWSAELPGAASSYSRSQGICEEPHSGVSIIMHRDYNSCSIYKLWGEQSPQSW